MAAVIEIEPVPVPAVVVKFVGAALLKAVAVAAGHTNVPPLNVRFLVPVAVVNAVPTVRVKPARLIVPLVSVNVRVDPIVSAPANVIVPPAALYVIGALIVTPLVVMFGLPVNVISPVADHVTLEFMLNDVPDIVRVPVLEKVGDLEDARNDWHAIAPDNVTVYAVVPLELVKKFTVSAVVGTEAPTVAAVML